MMVADTVIAVVAAGGGLGGVAALISALRTPPPSPVPPQPITAAPHPLRRRQSYRAAWPVTAGACACVISGALVAVVGATTVSLSQPVILLLAMATAIAAAVAIWGSSRVLRQGLSRGRPDLILYAAAGLVTAFAGLTATLIAASS